jgi:hypothetical protein
MHNPLAVVCGQECLARRNGRQSKNTKLPPKESLRDLELNYLVDVRRTVPGTPNGSASLNGGLPRF